MNTLLYCLIGYLIGIVPFAILLGRMIHRYNPSDEVEQ